eukprot:TRINITY_DN26155_c0_g1_i1.p1 TRINITY_DN26155_c0_g1~~TRINITY_DN26155_c0_g1_i1.p1  ORF type:complete len:117 (+),score=34.28 TRINITY_DN26155_c0_g1_i1:73-423(+)
MNDIEQSRFDIGDLGPLPKEEVLSIDLGAPENALDGTSEVNFNAKAKDGPSSLEYDPFRVPADLDQAKLHGRATRVGMIKRANRTNFERCLCCGFIATKSNAVSYTHLTLPTIYSV